MMAQLQTNVFENGEWVTRNLDPMELFRQTSSPQQAKPKKQPTVPTYGVLTKTVIESPVFHWVLPVQLRSTRHNDVAFIGDNFVQICELGRDVQLRDVAGKQDFGSRIRNAGVVGAPSNHEGFTNGTQIKTEEDDYDMLNAADQSRGTFPPQLLVLVLERGELVFLYLEESASGELTFISHGEKIPDSRLVSPGFHLAVDPSSRYLALACSETHFQVWKLESMDVLRTQHAEGRALSPIKGLPCPRAVRGVIHKIEFLSPGPDSEERIILVLLLINKGRSRLHRYEWELGDDVSAALHDSNMGWPLDPQYQMPLLVIPSTVRESFVLVTETSQAFWATFKTGALDVEAVDIGEHDKTDLHIGGREPLWTAWSRPWRLPEYHIDNDIIWLAREDGILNFLEITAGEGLLTNVIMGLVQCNIDTAFACLYDPFADILITGGDSGPGAIWRADPRKAPIKIGMIPDWSPTVDITSTHTNPGVLDTKASRTKSRGSLENGLPLKQDRIFVCSGRGKTGSIAELRHGLEAKVDLELDCGDPIKQCWTMKVPAGSMSDGFYLLLAFPNRSDILHVNNNWSEAVSKHQDEVPYDLSSTTLAAQELEDGTIVQVTTGSITIITSNESTRHFPHELDGESTSVITASAIGENMVALAFHAGSRFRVKTIWFDGLNSTQGPAYDVEGEVTCVVLSKLGGENVLLAGVWEAGRPSLMVYPTQTTSLGLLSEPIRLELSMLFPGPSDGSNYSGGLPPIEGITSIASFEERQERTSLSVGTRSGEVLTLTIEPKNIQGFRGTYNKFGFSGAHVFPMSKGSEPASIFVCCDSGLYLMTDLSGRKKPDFMRKHRIWVTDANSETNPSSELNAVSRMGRNLSQAAGKSTLALVSGSTVYISELQRLPKPVLRHLPVLGTPNKVLYHPRLDALVVAILQDGRPALRFIDPQSGVDLSLPTDSGGHEVEHITGLGKPGAQIIALAQWMYEKDGRTWSYIVVSVRSPDGSGQVLIITATRDDTTVSEDGSHKIRFSTKLKRSGYPEPVWSIATEAQGLILCSGNTIQYEMLDLEQRKLKKVKEHRLSSPASWMEVVDDKLHVVTIRHSLEIIDFLKNPDDESMTRLYSDDRAKQSIHCIQAVDTLGKSNHQPITLLSDLYCGLWGMWAPPQGDRPLTSIFHAELQASVRRFTRTRGRPQWGALGRQTKYGCIRSSADGADILGLSVDGSLRHFTILNADAWRLLRFIQNLASRSPDICPPPAIGFLSGVRDGEDSQDDMMEQDWDPEPKTLPVLNMQVDGGILQRCLDKQALGNLVSQPEHAARLRQLLEALEAGRYTEKSEGFEEMSDYLELAYDILDYYLAPVL